MSRVCWAQPCTAGFVCVSLLSARQLSLTLSTDRDARTLNNATSDNSTYVHRRLCGAARATRRCGAPLRHIALRPGWAQGHVTYVRYVIRNCAMTTQDIGITSASRHRKNFQGATLAPGRKLNYFTFPLQLLLVYRATLQTCVYAFRRPSVPKDTCEEHLRSASGRGRLLPGRFVSTLIDQTHLCEY